jgi:hypothetical protein
MKKLTKPETTTKKNTSAKNCCPAARPKLEKTAQCCAKASRLIAGCHD